MANQKVYIPTFIANENFEPARVNPRLFFYNGNLDVPEFKVQGYVDSPTSIFVTGSTQMPYFDHYNVVTGSFPSQGSDSLLFRNESAAYGTPPTSTLFSEYWDEYIELLYNPRTRLIKASATIPIAQYFKLELNNVIEFRGNYFHLRSINDYSLTTGECEVELLGPILDTTLDAYFNYLAEGGVPNEFDGGQGVLPTE
jgi:hypothetical protein